MNTWQLDFIDLIDIALVALVVYFVLRLIRGTRAEQMLIGLAVVFLLYEISQRFDLLTLEWIFSQFFSVFIVILVVLFQHEIRRGLMRVAVNPLAQVATPREIMIAALVDSSVALVKRGWGGLIVIERETGLKHLYDSGVDVDATLRSDMIEALFCPQAPMHDGAVIVVPDQDVGRIAVARVLLPLAQANAVPGGFGTRHRAAVGLTEESDALVIVVSEENGAIHLVENGQMGETVSQEMLAKILAKKLMHAREINKHGRLS
ncbi:MAG: diadenylate cyclase [Mariprofundaceae bacterium]